MSQSTWLPNKPLFIQLLVFIALIVATFSLISLLSFLLIPILFDVNMLTTQHLLADYNNPKAIRVLKFLQFSQSLSFIIPPLLFSYLHSRSLSSYIKLKAYAPTRFYLLAAIAMLVVSPFISWLVLVNEKMNLPEAFFTLESWMKSSEAAAAKLTEAFLAVDTIGELAINLLIMALMAAVGEEFLFRGVLQRMLHERLNNVHAAVITTAVIFSAFHMQFYGFLPRLVLGTMLGYLFYFSGSIWIPVLAHFVNNAAGVLGNYLYRKKLISINPDDEAIFPTYSVIISLVLTLLIFYYFYKNRREDGYQLENGKKLGESIYFS